ncbi:hypothetical protein LIER_05563 [Lithospermum erythrorhizon]|uniref:Uncharacterized protein n=1 Tax=Lithospermum erythrorhizon TaxID=34254 RepID=A0AAV3P153_LITER
MKEDGEDAESDGPRDDDETPTRSRCLSARESRSSKGSAEGAESGDASEENDMIEEAVGRGSGRVQDPGRDRVGRGKGGHI